ncbi:catalase [Oceanobacillus bengalensis]|uniref:Catalase n=1 Tax=Oceanobacillus bengalensis TaxID=1435466 RepID=A0A494YZC8_9BACI|nr:catalase [Oceanobacillus bengalensis]RKQ15596.1 catalase [Oceanobacillus bengalensis]
MSEKPIGNKNNKKHQQLEQFRVNDANKKLTTNQGLKVSEDGVSLTAGRRGPTLMEDFHFREKMTHFDHERIPERVVHARGTAAHGEFEVYESMKPYTKAKFLQDPNVKTPVFVRFSTVVGFRGSADTVRDVRGFATKFYTDEGNYDLVTNNMPVFFIQDGMKFPDIVHAIKPEPHNEIPQASGAHDTFWDFVANNQESAHQVMWLMSPRAIPRSYRMMQGFGIHAFRFVNDGGKAHFVKFHWIPKLGVHSLVWDEAQKIAGKNPDFNRQDLYDAIEMGNFPEFELGVQIIEEKDEFAFDFDILDSTKIWPEEDVPVKIIGKLTLNRNVDNFFAETEQVAFHPGHVVPGIDFTNDPLLQGRLFSYTDTQLIRLGGPNFHEIPINKAVCPFHNNQRDGYHRQTINVGKVAYHNNSLAANTPAPATEEEGGFVHYQEKVEGSIVQSRSESFSDHFSQPKLFWNSMSPNEKQHIIDAFSFEVGHVKDKKVRQQVVDMFANVDLNMATKIAYNLGATPPTGKESTVTKASPALSQENTIKTAVGRKIGVILHNGFHDAEVKDILQGLNLAGVAYEIISGKQGVVTGKNNVDLMVDHTFTTTDPVLYDGIYIIGGDDIDNTFYNKANYFVKEAFKHYKPIGASFDGVKWLEENSMLGNPGIVEGNGNTFVETFVQAIAEHRHWDRKVV